MARILVTGGLGWDVPLWLDRPLRSGGRIGARALSQRTPAGALPGRLGGGAGNIASALARAGHIVLVAGRIGADAAGACVLEALQARGLSCDGVRVDELPTPSAQVLIEPNGERTLLGIGWAGVQRDAWTLDPDLVDGFAPEALVLRASAPAIARVADLIVAHMPWRGVLPLRADVAIGSHDDLGPAALDQPFAAARAVFAGVGWGVVTDGPHGARAQSDSALVQAQARPAQVIDATGAGDIFMAGLTDALVSGATMPEALAHACAWGAVAVGIEGSAPGPGATGFTPFIPGPDAS